LDYVEFDLGHSGTGDIDVQFFIQGSLGFNFVALGPDVAVGPGVSTYQLPLGGLTFEQQVYIRTIGFNVRDHAAEGNVTWTLEEVRSGGTPLAVRDLVTHDAGSSDGGLQGAFTNVDLGAILGNDGGQNQTGLVQNLVDGSLQWIDLGEHGVGDPRGGAISYGNGTVFNGNSFNYAINGFQFWPSSGPIRAMRGEDPNHPASQYIDFNIGMGGVTRPVMSLHKIQDGATNTIMLAELWTGLSPNDRRGVWAMGMCGSNFHCLHAALPINSCGGFDDDVYGVGEIYSDAGNVSGGAFIGEDPNDIRPENFRAWQRLTVSSDGYALDKLQ